MIPSTSTIPSHQPKDNPMHQPQAEQPHAPLVCGAATRNGGTCRNPPMLGGTRCRMHGGAAPQVRAKAAAEQQQARAADLLRAQGIEPVADPVAALRAVAGEHRVLTAAARQTMAEAAERDGLEVTAGQPIAALYEKSLANAGRLLARMTELGIGPDIDPGDVLRATAIIDALRQTFRLARTTDLDEAEILSRVVGLEESTNP